MISFRQIEGSIINWEMLKESLYYEIFVIYKVEKTTNQLLLAMYSTDYESTNNSDYIEITYQIIDNYSHRKKEEFHIKQVIKVDGGWMDDRGNYANDLYDFLPVQKKSLVLLSETLERVIELERE